MTYFVKLGLKFMVEFKRKKNTLWLAKHAKLKSSLRWPKSPITETVQCPSF